SIDRAIAAREPHQIWNAFVELLTEEENADLSPRQRTAYLPFWYDAEGQNGGHGQYFENQGLEGLGETVEALRTLGLKAEADRRGGAGAALPRRGKREWEDVLGEDFIEELDEAFEACEPSVIDALQRHLEAHRAEYVDVT